MTNKGHENEVMERLKSDGAPQRLIDTFLHHYRGLVAGETGLIPDDALEPPRGIEDLEAAAPHASSGKEALARTIVIKLNGGLGTSMGLARAKSLLPVKDGLTFLDIIARQVLHLRKETSSAMPLLLMNSPGTDADSLEALSRHATLGEDQPGIPLSFLQHRVPKIERDSLQPATWPSDPGLTWCPPGHGDLYTAMVTSGILDSLLAKGYAYAFVSNADNLGATLDPSILGYLADKGIPFLMEVTERTEADRKGGHLAAREDGRLLLREVAQCPDEDLGSFQDITKYRFFNTNNLWIDLPSLKRLLDETHTIDLPVIFNHKTVDPRDPGSTAVVQLETAMGSALSLFEGAQALNVPRTRFAPVKTTSDLLGLWSDCYELTEAFHMKIRPERGGTPPDIVLDPTYYKLLDDFESRFPEGAPSLIECSRLSIEGDVVFSKGVTVKGDVSLAGENGQRILETGTVLQG